MCNTVDIQTRCKGGGIYVYGMIFFVPVFGVSLSLRGGVFVFLSLRGDGEREPPGVVYFRPPM